MAPKPEAPVPTSNDGTPIKRRQPGYYPGFSTLSQQSFWDSTTRKVVLDRVTDIPPIRFFTPEEAETMALVLDHILPQSDREESRRIPVLPFMDKNLFEKKISGFRYEDMPPEQEAYHIGLRGIEQMAREVHGRAFVACTYAERELLLQSLNDDKPAGAQQQWKQLNVKRFWKMLLHDAAAVYYAHPWAWDEIGFGGPAYPRGYMRLENGRPEPWEVEEERYAWNAPEGTRSEIKRKF
ncbi:MAG: gluconate 2-dehydrogenase subunit 3 family protein [Acidobacteriaceae bacterium]